jgi:hypothetical protein
MEHPRINPVKQREIEWDCEKLLIRFMQALDDRRYEGLANLFSENGVWFRPGQKLIGPAMIFAALKDRPAKEVRRHVVSNCTVSVQSEDKAEARSYLTVWAGDSDETGSRPVTIKAPFRVGVATTRFVRSNDRWQITEHSFEQDFAF